jgi:hypothetical protein
MNRIGGIMVSMHASYAEDRRFDSRPGQTKDYKIGICCFSKKQYIQNISIEKYKIGLQCTEKNPYDSDVEINTRYVPSVLQC